MAFWLWTCCCQDDGDTAKANFITLHPSQDQDLLSEGCPGGGGCSPLAAVHQPVIPGRHRRPPEAAAAEGRRAEEGRVRDSRLVVLEHPGVSPQSAPAPVGLHLDPSDGKVLYVCGLRPGRSLVGDHNAMARAEECVGPGQYIVSVNGESASSWAMAQALHECHGGRGLALEVQRPHRFTLHVERNGDCMGLDLNYSDSGTSLLIMQIGEGAMRKHAHQVNARDRIESVNGRRGKAQDLLDAIRDADHVTLGISRCPGLSDRRL